MKQWVAALRRSVTEDWPVLAGAGTIWIALLLVLSTKGVDGFVPASYRSNLLLYVLTLVVLVLVQVGRLLYRERPDSPIGFLAAVLRQGTWAERLARGIPMLAALIVFMPAFSAMKAAIPLFQPFAWDAAFIAADQALHGQDAWLLLQPLLGFPIITSALSVVYLAWFFVIYAASIYFCFLSPDRERRTQYFIAYFACWTVCGVVLATLFSSVGPFFAGPLLGDPRFDGQMAYLREANEHYPVLILKAQEFLLQAQQESSSGLGAGISAMPSMHVSMALLVALSLGRISRGWAIAGYAFFALIQIGSVHLGPHYAVDGYVSSAVTLVIWALAGQAARWLSADRTQGEPAPQSQPGMAPA